MQEQLKKFAPIATALVMAGGLAGCADDSSNLGNGGNNGPADPTPCVVFCGPVDPPNPTGLDDCNPNNPLANFLPISGNVKTVDVSIEGLCPSCRIASPVSTFDNNLSTFSTDTAGVGVAASLSQLGYGPLNYVTSPTVRRRIGFFVSYPTGSTADVALLANTAAYTVNATGADVQGPGQTADTALSLQLVGTPVLPGQSLAFVSVVTSQTFNGARLSFSPTVGVLAGLDVIEACISK